MLKPADRWGAQLKAKINISGPRQAKFCDSCLGVNAVLQVRGVYIQNNIGLKLETTHIQFAQKGVNAEDHCPF